eukprot:218617-Rhodomonas_salina.1
MPDDEEREEISSERWTAVRAIRWAGVGRGSRRGGEDPEVEEEEEDGTYRPQKSIDVSLQPP